MEFQAASPGAGGIRQFGLFILTGPNAQQDLVPVQPELRKAVFSTVMFNSHDCG
jgi:hypothetical protein